MDRACCGSAAVVEDLHRDPLRLGRNADRGAAAISPDDHPHRPGAMAIYIGWNRRMLTIRIVPTIASAAPLSRQIWVRIVNAGVHICHHKALPIKTALPQRWSVDQAEILRGHAGCRADLVRPRRRLDGDIRDDLAHRRHLRQFGDHRAGGGHGDSVLDPQGRKGANLALVLPLLEQGTQADLGGVRFLAQRFDDPLESLSTSSPADRP